MRKSAAAPFQSYSKVVVQLSLTFVGDIRESLFEKSPHQGSITFGPWLIGCQARFIENSD
jgi:hypothetical protein